MKFIERQVPHKGKKKLIKVDENNIPIPYEETIFVNILKDEGEPVEGFEGTPINAENLNKGNWRDDDSLSFKKSNLIEPPDSDELLTQIMTTKDGEVWIITPTGKKVKLSESAASMAQQISQTTGESETIVMSQKAVTSSLNTKQNKLTSGDNITIDNNVINASVVRGRRIWTWSTVSNLTNISSISGCEVGDIICNTSSATLTILGVLTEIGGLVQVNTSTTGASAGSIRGATGATGAMGATGAIGSLPSWAAIWNGVISTVNGTATIYNINNYTDIMLVALSTSTNTTTTMLIPRAHISPFVSSSSGTGASSNTFRFSSQDGISNQYDITVRFNSTTQIIVTSRNNTNLIGVWAR